MNRARTSLGVGLLGLAVITSLLVRCLPFANFANPAGGFYFYSIDSYDHLRRITLDVARFPGLANFDYYAAFPQGLGQIWAPGFDFCLALLCRLAGGSLPTIETICFFFNPLAAVLGASCAFLVARAVFRSSLAGGVAALVLALHPAFLADTLPMNFDHHSVEPLVVLSLFALPLLERRGRLSPAGTALAALALLLALFIWRGSTIYWGLFFLTVAARVLLTDDRLAARAYAAVFGAAAGLLALYCLLDPWGGARQLSFAVISWFHVVILMAAGAALLLYRLCPSRRLFGWWAGGLALLVVIAALAPRGPLAGVARQIATGLSFVRGQGDPWLDSNSELRGVFRSRLGLMAAASYLTAFWFATPVAVWEGARQWWRTGKGDFPLLAFCTWSPVWAMGFVIRYSNIAGVFASLAAGYLAARLEERRQTRHGRWLLAGAALLLLVPSWPHYREAMSARLPDPMRLGLYGEHGVLAWLRERTPPTAAWLDPVRQPEYGVLARWSMGARIYQVARRPAVATAFGWEAYGFYQEAAFWTAEDEERALAVAREAKVRYVVVQAGQDLDTDFQVARQGQERGSLPAATVGPELRPGRVIYTRLLGDGAMLKAGGDLLPALGSLRLVYESDYRIGQGTDRPSNVSYYKIFEIVSGAVLRGRVRPGEGVILALELKSGRGRTFSYLSRVFAGPDGDFSLRLPYASDARQGDTEPLGPYAVYVGKERHGTLTVSESDVESGRELALPEAP